MLYHCHKSSKEQYLMWILTRGKINLSGGGKDKCLGGKCIIRRESGPLARKGQTLPCSQCWVTPWKLRMVIRMHDHTKNKITTEFILAVVAVIKNKWPVFWNCELVYFSKLKFSLFWGFGWKPQITKSPQFCLNENEKQLFSSFSSLLDFL